MDKTLKRKLYAEILAHIPFLQATIKEQVITALLEVDDITAEEEAKLLEEKKAQEIAELTAKKAEAEKVLADANAKLSLLTKEPILITK